MTYHQITGGERYMLAALRRQGLNQSQVGRALGRHRSTISRELKRNRCALDGRYRASKAQERTNGRRSRSRRNQRFTCQDYELIDNLLCRQWSPEQVAGHLRLSDVLSVSHETIYQHLWRDKAMLSAMVTTTAVGDWLANATSQNGPHQQRPAVRGDTGRSTPSWTQAARTAS